ncbi:metal ABC transporter permease [Cytobacillus spongiae]|uniref:metal ABC transporter permease n=1 Tax=Cytobacillus spongiae TaxID=2901381 RepID=UPI001F26AC24|nr:metal ABC transporter permease [Cytobacillus spongiae]UII57121.1 metal ABC transporter permease [Cytobacillus spongiae]
MNDVIQMILNDANTQWVLLGTMLLGIASGVLGSIALLRKQSLIGDAVAHAALPGICIAFLITGEKSLIALLIGATITGLLAAYCIQFITSTSILKEDTAICLILSVFFGFGIVLLTKVSQSSSGNKSGLDDFIFGQAASLVGNDVKLMAGAAFVLIFITGLLFKELKVLTFDPAFARGLGLPTALLNFLFLSLLVAAVVIGIQAVGVILMAAMLITPSIAARYWTNSLGKMVVISGFFGALSGMIGTIVSTFGEGLATGPFIVVTATVLFFISMLFAPERGLLTKWVKRMLFNKQTRKEQVLRGLYKLSEEKYLTSGNEHYEVPKRMILTQLGYSERNLDKLLQELIKDRFLHESDSGWSLSKEGILKAYELTMEQRITEICLMHRDEFNEEEKDEITDKVMKEPSDPMTKRVLQLLEQYNMTPALSPVINERKRLS